MEAAKKQAQSQPKKPRYDLHLAGEDSEGVICTDREGEDDGVDCMIPWHRSG